MFSYSFWGRGRGQSALLLHSVRNDRWIAAALLPPHTCLN
jgi:hypothetical protein